MFHFSEPQASAQVGQLKTMAATAGLDWAAVLQLIFSQGLPLVLQLLQELIQQKQAATPTTPPPA